jgi:hypothetical protein
MEGKRPIRGSNDATTSRNDWPELGAPMTSVQGQAESITTESTGGIVIDDGFSTSMRHDTPFQSSHEATEQLGQAGSSGSAPTIRKAGASGYGRPCRATAHRKIQGVDPESFWNAERGRYYCNCGASFLFLSTFEYHLTMEDETINEYLIFSVPLSCKETLFNNPFLQLPSMLQKIQNLRRPRRTHGGSIL